MPAGFSPVADLTVARMYLGTAATYGANAAHRIPFDTIGYDPAGLLTTGATANYQCPSDGYYFVCLRAVVTSNSNGDQMWTEVWINGAITGGGRGQEVNASSATQPLSSISTQLIKCNSGDFIAGAVNNNSGSGYTAAIGSGEWATKNFISVHRAI